MEIFAVYLDASEIRKRNFKTQFDSLLGYLSDEQVDKVNRLMSWEDKLKTVIGMIIVRREIMRRTGKCNDKIVFELNQYGKPFLKGEKRLEFNVSHSGDWVVCVFNDKSVGIDVEKIKEIDYKNLTNEFFSNGEIEFINTTSEKGKLNHFYMLWTLKESYIKAIGKGLYIPLDSFEIKFDNKIESGVQNIDDYKFRTFKLDKYHMMSVCTRKSMIQRNIVYDRLETVMNNPF